MEAKKVKVFYDVKTTGTNVKKHSIHQIAGIIEVNGKVAETFSLNTRPHPKAVYDPAALEVGNVTEEQLRGYPEMAVAQMGFVSIICKYVDTYDSKDKAWLIGFNNRGFDDVFLRAWFEQNGDKYIGSLFWNDTRDCLVLASEYLEDRRHTMPSFQLKRVAMELGIVVNIDKLHDAAYDVELTRKIYRIVTGKEIEI